MSLALSRIFEKRLLADELRIGRYLINVGTANLIVGGEICHKQCIHGGELTDSGGQCYFVQGTFPCLCVQDLVRIVADRAVRERSGSNCVDAKLLSQHDHFTGGRGFAGMGDSDYHIILRKAGKHSCSFINIIGTADDLAYSLKLVLGIAAYKIGSAGPEKEYLGGSF